MKFILKAKESGIDDAVNTLHVSHKEYGVLLSLWAEYFKQSFPEERYESLYEKLQERTMSLHIVLDGPEGTYGAIFDVKVEGEE